MNVAVEQGHHCRRMHSCDVPGLAVTGEAGLPLAMEMRAEAERFRSCFPWLTIPSVQVCTVTERVENPQLQPQTAAGVLLAVDLDRTPEELARMCRLLRESAALFWRCYRSFPDAAYDYMDGAEHPDWMPGSGDEAMHRYVRQLTAAYRLWGVKPCGGDWLPQLEAILEELQKTTEFAENWLFHTAEGPCCAGYWLRCRIEECHLAGRYLYELGISAFGRYEVEDSFCFGL